MQASSQARSTVVRSSAHFLERGGEADNQRWLAASVTHASHFPDSKMPPVSGADIPQMVDFHDDVTTWVSDVFSHIFSHRTKKVSAPGLPSKARSTGLCTAVKRGRLLLCLGPGLLHYHLTLFTLFWFTIFAAGLSSRAPHPLHPFSPASFLRLQECLRWNTHTAYCQGKERDDQASGASACAGFLAADVRVRSPGPAKPSLSLAASGASFGSVGSDECLRSGRAGKGLAAVVSSFVAVPTTSQTQHDSVHSPTKPLFRNFHQQPVPAPLPQSRLLPPLGAFPFLGRKRGDADGDAQTDDVSCPESVPVDMDLYGLVGVSKEAEKTEIDARFRQAQKELCDVGGDPSVLNMLRAAHAVLTDDDMRSAYDNLGRVPVNVARAFLLPSSTNGSGEESAHYSPERHSARDADSHALGEEDDENDQQNDEAVGTSPPGLMKVFSSFFGGSNARRRRTSLDRVRGNDVWASVTLQLSEIGCGDAEKQVTVEALESCDCCEGTGGKDGQKATACTACDGKGAIVKTTTTNVGIMRTSQTCQACRGSGEEARLRCSNCSGSGRVKNEKTLQVMIPAGVSDGMRLRIKGQGDVGVNGGPPGDLLLKVEVENDTAFRREGNNLLGIVRISYIDAILGLEDKPIEVIDGVAHITIPPGTQSGEKIVVKGRGAQDPGMTTREMSDRALTTTRGDHIAVIEVELPRKVSKEERELLERLRLLRRL
ncbi:DnaJ C terminal region domain-containing protein [Toxoplasma gondii MAS]|uniref:DnaJ C terminal region domain-containing protein n=2 Tax=Toxoplasma gondii TaxID=5811 RepID=A0A086QQS3_TOXGO|nr:DnaJ C terminal region domain-containing protein [Toxoplasma gondii MAS]PUA89102.1 DnaJ C terminal region domain-containing protein [Toxoplasma gondii TgCATBr9]